jgi:hypothetical protein
MNLEGLKMCDATAAIQGGQAYAEYQQKRKETDAANAAANASIVSGREDYNYQTGVAQEDYQVNNRAQNQNEFDIILANRAAKATAVTSAATSGVTGRSVTDTISAIVQAGARNVVRTKDQESVLERAYDAQSRGLQKNLEQVIASNPLTEGPSPLGVVLGIGGATAGADQRQRKNGGTGFLPDFLA